MKFYIRSSLATPDVYYLNNSGNWASTTENMCFFNSKEQAETYAIAQTFLCKYEVRERRCKYCNKQCHASEECHSTHGSLAQKDNTTTDTLKLALMLRSALEEAHDAMQAFTDPEGDMPENTGEFRDLKLALESARRALGTKGQHV